MKKINILMIMILSTMLSYAEQEQLTYGGWYLKNEFPHNAQVFSVCFDSSGKLLATGSYDGKARIFDIDTQKEIVSFSHNSSVFSVCFDVTGKLLATGSYDGKTRIFNINTHEEIILFSDDTEVSSVCFDPSGKLLAIASGYKGIKIFDINTRKEIVSFIGISTIYSVCFDPSGKLIATGGFDEKARIFDIKAHKEIASFSHGVVRNYRSSIGPIYQNNAVREVCFDSSGKYLATGSGNNKAGEARVFNINTHKEIASFPHNSNVISVYFDPSGQYLATGSGDDKEGKARIFDINIHKEIASFPYKKCVTSVRFDHSGKLLATGSLDDKACIFVKQDKWFGQWLQNIKQLVHEFGQRLFGKYSPTKNITCNDLKNCFTGSMLAGGIGDALGRVTEHINSTDAIFKKYPHGVQTYDDFTPDNWEQIPIQLKKNKIAPYTDDTGMARLVMKELIKAQQNNWDLNTTMDALARSFIIDAQAPMGWMAYFRPIGKACVNGVNKLSNILSSTKNIDLSPRWWDIHADAAGGCGSVMRAHPFGLIFTNNPEKAALWAAEHSRLTHSAPIALAACAAMATGIAYAVQEKTPEFIVKKMIEAAQTYDSLTAKKILMAYDYAQHAKKLRKPFNDIFDAYKNHRFRIFNDRVFDTFPGWAADDAIAAVTYAFTLSPNNIMEAIYLGVHTPGDNDSIASMAGALVGARIGIEQLPKKLINKLEDSTELISDAIKAADLLKECGQKKEI